MLTNELEQNDRRVYWKNDHCNTLHEAFNRLPLYLNILSLRGYEKILFVGHFNAAEKHWTHSPSSDRIIHNTPAEQWSKERVVDMNVVMQFLPMVKMDYGYRSFDMHVLVPPESRHRDIMHSMYKQYKVDLVPCSWQYKHGMDNCHITPPPDQKYDAIVFAGVPKARDDISFTKNRIHKIFGQHMTKDYDIIDLYYQNEDPMKFYGDTKEDLNTELVNVWANRALWDDKYTGLRPESKQIEFDILKLMFNVYSIKSSQHS
jgi:hypothetical protein